MLQEQKTIQTGGGNENGYASKNQPTAAILIIGNEILSGRTVDKNIHFLAAELDRLNIPVCEVRVVRDDMKAIGDAVQALSAAYFYVFTSGGIGPTHDDITAEAMALAFNRPFIVNEEAMKRLENHYGDALNEPRRSMALMPEGAGLIDNPVSAAPGFIVENVYVMAGVPSILQVMFKSVEFELVGGDPIFTESVVFDVAESLLAQPLSQIQQTYGNVEIGSYPSFKYGKLSVTIVLRSRDRANLEKATLDVKTIAPQII